MTELLRHDVAIIRGALTADECKALRRVHRATLTADAFIGACGLATHLGVRDARSARRVLAQVAAVLGCPDRPARIDLCRMCRRRRQPMHTDAPPDYDVAELVPTMIISLSPATAFEGASVHVDGLDPIDLDQGDAVAFTARTLHRVTPQTAGRRYFVLAMDNRIYVDPGDAVGRGVTAHGIADLVAAVDRLNAGGIR